MLLRCVKSLKSYAEFRSCSQVVIDIALHTRKIEITCKIAAKFLNSPRQYILYSPPLKKNNFMLVKCNVAAFVVIYAAFLVFDAAVRAVVS